MSLDRIRVALSTARQCRSRGLRGSHVVIARTLLDDLRRECVALEREVEALEEQVRQGDLFEVAR